jgi:hypothetical protein
LARQLVFNCFFFYYCTHCFNNAQRWKNDCNLVIFVWIDTKKVSVKRQNSKAKTLILIKPVFHFNRRPIVVPHYRSGNKEIRFGTIRLKWKTSFTCEKLNPCTQHWQHKSTQILDYLFVFALYANKLLYEIRGVGWFWCIEILKSQFTIQQNDIIFLVIVR